MQKVAKLKKQASILSPWRGELRRLKKAIVVGVTSAALLLGVPAMADAETGGCYASSCTGKNPQGLCDGDAITVGRQAITYGDDEVGTLELRYSPSCAANWGRYTALTELKRTTLIFGKDFIYGRVTVWNPGEESQGVYRKSIGSGDDSSWSYMTDGTKVACTGVEPFFEDPTPYGWLMSRPDISAGWQDGPCY
ncbi:YjfA family protein [Streptomyces sp. NBC_00285]|uniref:DUF2690 domain-containing protein n=1 Tax=Streptomyces sp. NBC_00285 TaxID=2975700 RepID=UPI002E2ABD5D|nr:DUF2690 domain-containing protein [Streptomyces sp. NBC_00285]